MSVIYHIHHFLGYEHNWDTAGGYPVQLMQAAGDAFDGVAFHCYNVRVAYGMDHGALNCAGKRRSAGPICSAVSRQGRSHWIHMTSR